ncbi:MAG TPA: NADH-quinone oxidoreductase subunit J [Planctomycetota bacterium]
MNDRFFALLVPCVIAVVSAASMLITRRLVRCAALLLVHSLSIAAAYFMLSADFLAMGQVIVYSGAIVVLFLFVVLLLPDGGREVPVPRSRALVGLIAGTSMLLAIGMAMRSVLAAAEPPAPPTADLSVLAIARELFGSQLVPFELTALLLLIAIIGAVTLWHRGERGEAA